MKKLLSACYFLCAFFLVSKSEITCTFLSVQIDSNQSYQLDVNGDGTNDYLLVAAYTPYVNNYIVGFNGNEVEVTWYEGDDADRARRIISGDPVGSLYWNDTAYMIQNGLGAFAGGSDEYGMVGLRLNNGGSYRYAFLELRAPYWQAMVAVYAMGYDDSGAQLRTDVCPHPVAVQEAEPVRVNAFFNDNTLHVSLGEEPEPDSEIHLMNVAGQKVRSEKLLERDSNFAWQDIETGIYLVVLTNSEGMVYRKKIFIP